MDFKNSVAGTPRRLRALKVVIGVVVFLLLIAVLGFLVAPPIIKSVAVDRLSAQLHRPVSIGAVHINPFMLTFEVDAFSVQDKDGASLASLDKIYTQLGISSILQLTPVVNQLRLDGPKFRLVRVAPDRYNISDLLDQWAAASKEAKPPPKPEDAFHFSLNNIEIHGGRLEFVDGVVNKTHLLSDIEIGLPFVSNLPKQTEIFVEPAFSAKIDGAPFGIKGRTKPFADSLDTEVSLDLDNLQLGKFFDYAPKSLAVKLPSGAIASRLKLTFSEQHDQPSTLILSGTLALTDLALTQADDRPLLEFKRLDVELRSVDLLKRKLSVASVKLQAPKFNVVLGRDGRTNWESALTGSAKPESAPAKAAAPPAKPPASAQDNSPSLAWAIDQINVADGSVRWLDDRTAAPAPAKGGAKPGVGGGERSLDGISITVQNLSSEENTPAKVAIQFSVDQKGAVSIDGQVTPAPLDAALNVDLKGIELPPWQRYLADKVDLTIARGQVAAHGTVLAKSGKSGALSGGFKGQVAITDFNSVEKLHASDFVSWKSLGVDGLDVQLDPLAVSIDQISLSNYYARVIVSPTGELNLLHINHGSGETPPAGPGTSPPVAASSPQGAPGTESAPPAPAKAPPAGAASVAQVAPKAAPTVPIRIGKIALMNGNVKFTDHFVRPNYTADLTKVEGQISGLSTAPDSQATLDLKAMYSGSAPVRVNGKLNPLAAKPSLDIQAEVHDVDLPAFSTYAGKYAGYAVEKGKLSMSVKYKIENSKLVAENHIRLDQLTFGDKIASPTATKLPVLLAVALLKDSDGVIDIDLPIQGSLDDPQFSIGGIIVHVIVNLIAKAVTAPFALLGSLFGGGQELSNMDFNSGSYTITDDGRKRLEGLSKALLGRPGLKLEVSGSAAAGVDQDGLKHAILEHQIKAQMVDDAAHKGVPSAPADELQIDPAQYPVLIERAYRAKNAPPAAPAESTKEKSKPKKGETPKAEPQPALSTKEMEDALLAGITITEENLHALAEHRAEAARDWLVDEGKIPADRIFLLPPKVQGEAAAAAPEKTSAAKANFSLR